MLSSWSSGGHCLKRLEVHLHGRAVPGCGVPGTDGAGAGRKQPAGLPVGQAARFQLAHQLPPKTLPVTAGHGRPERVGTI